MFAVFFISYNEIFVIAITAIMGTNKNMSKKIMSKKIMSKKIMFNDRYFLTQAVLDGTKTMTRRAVPQSLLDEYDVWYEDFIYKPIGEEKYLSVDEYVLKRTHYKVGEVVAIAQSYKSIADERAEAETVLGLYKIGDNLLTMDEMGAGWNNKMFVKADLLPHHIRITDIKVERLQDISEGECLHEGIGYHRYRDEVWSDDSLWGYYVHKNELLLFDTPHEAFISLIDKIMGKGTWESNPWVVAYGFELVD
jgi:hypothetical protein